MVDQKRLCVFRVRVLPLQLTLLGILFSVIRTRSYRAVLADFNKVVSPIIVYKPLTARCHQLAEHYFNPPQRPLSLIDFSLRASQRPTGCRLPHLS